MNTRTKITILSSSLISLLLIVSSLLFLLIFNNSIEQILVEDLHREYDEITSLYLETPSNKRIEITDDDLEVLQLDAQTDQMSILIIDQFKNRIGVFGKYEYELESEDEDDPSSIEIEGNKIEVNINSQEVNSALLGHEVVSFITVDEVKYVVLTIPIVNDSSEVLGVMQLVTEETFFSEIKSRSVMIAAITIIIGVSLSFGVGHWVTRILLKPITKISSRMQKANLENLNIELQDIGVRLGDPIYEISEEFNSLIRRLKKSYKKQSNFISSASHELKTPLSVMSTTLDLMISQEKGSKERKDLKRLHNDVLNMGKLIDNLLFLSRVEDKHIIKENSTVNFEKVVKRVVNLFKSEIKLKQLTVKYSGDLDVDVQLNGDYLERILHNLISNAVNYSKTHGEIAISTTSHLNKFRFKISDNGIGMSQEDQSMIFDRFYRGQNSYSYAKGTGIGMSIVQEICREYNLSISIESKLDAGFGIIISGINISK